MSNITIQSGTILNYEGNEAALELRAYVNQAFTSSSSEAVPAGRLHTPNFFVAVPCTISLGTITYQAHVLESTTDAISDPKRASYTYALYAPSGAYRSLVYKRLRVPATPTTTTLAALASYSLANPPEGDVFYTQDQMNDLFYTKVASDIRYYTKDQIDADWYTADEIDTLLEDVGEGGGGANIGQVYAISAGYANP